MKCPTCNVNLQPTKSVCPSCQTILSNPNLGTLASPVRRLVAYIIDYGVGLFLYISFILSMFDETGEAGLFMIITLFVFSFIQLYMMTKSTSLGKRIMKLKVYKKTGEKVGFGLMFLRETIGKIISGMIFSLGYLWILIDDENQAWHDKFINSIVVREYF